MGSPFNGSLVCAPFLEFIDADKDEGESITKHTTFIPVADEAFVFFYNEQEQELLKRFAPWRERVLTVALQELSQNL